MNRIILLLAVTLLVFLGLQVWIQAEFLIPDVLRFYLADLLCMPLVLSICLLVVRYLKKDPSIRLSLFSIFSLFVFYSVYFEILMPKIHERYTADFLDVLMYFLGSFIFLLVQKQPRKEIYSR